MAETQRWDKRWHSSDDHCCFFIAQLGPVDLWGCNTWSEEFAVLNSETYYSIMYGPGDSNWNAHSTSSRFTLFGLSAAQIRAIPPMVDKLFAAFCVEWKEKIRQVRISR